MFTQCTSVNDYFALNGTNPHRKVDSKPRTNIFLYCVLIFGIIVVDLSFGLKVKEIQTRAKVNKQERERERERRHLEAPTRRGHCPALAAPHNQRKTADRPVITNKLISNAACIYALVLLIYFLIKYDSMHRCTFNKAESSKCHFSSQKLFF